MPIPSPLRRGSGPHHARRTSRAQRLAAVTAFAALATLGTGTSASGAASAAHTAMPRGTVFSGDPQVGAVFRNPSGSLPSHQCTGSVVDSPKGDLVITAAHCVYDASGPETGLVFVPQYDDGDAPYGSWNVSAVYAAKQWSSGRSPNYDVAFLEVHQSGSSTPIQDLVGADTLAVDQPASRLTTVVGYPSSSNAPITCTNRTTRFSRTQLRFDCRGYSSGTSGSPFLTHVDAQTGLGTVDGVIGGYQAGGNTADISYSMRFNEAVESLYQQAVRAK
ncbi:trypsin-like peptidase domain-containing protein [Actinospica durhamensis]|uniref:Trypsin-like peptidase domain-containing protein n=1 Tax=Actinospica durhamensis TaxID=1508375 RepID=A0A941IT17_9ACTN|nr:serine protease [Actinospica durhamensis]MBR7833861.1 trypsin-like peptidase domain-containing protein [Actinospica durhamensis]